MSRLILQAEIMTGKLGNMRFSFLGLGLIKDFHFCHYYKIC